MTQHMAGIGDLKFSYATVITITIAGHTYDVTAVVPASLQALPQAVRDDIFMTQVTAQLAYILQREYANLFAEIDRLFAATEQPSESGEDA